MNRLRALGGDVVITALAIIGLLVGFSLGVVTDRGIGLIAVVGAIVGAGAGVWIAQQVLAGRDEDDAS